MGITHPQPLQLGHLPESSTNHMAQKQSLFLVLWTEQTPHGQQESGLLYSHAQQHVHAFQAARQECLLSDRNILALSVLAREAVGESGGSSGVAQSSTLPLKQ